MASISGLAGLKAKLNELTRKLKDDSCEGGTGNTIVVGYTAKYAIYVHENLTARHAGYVFVTYKSGKRRVHFGTGQAKFLEQPYRELRQELLDMIGKLVEKGLTPIKAMYLAGLRLQRESQKLCPIDTGNLKNSAFTRAIYDNASSS